MSCSVGGRRGSNLALLWLWCRPAAVAPIRPLAWEPPYAAGGALKRQKDQKEEEEDFSTAESLWLCFLFLPNIWGRWGFLTLLEDTGSELPWSYNQQQEPVLIGVL